MRSVISGAFFTTYRWPIVFSGAAALIDVLSAGPIAPLVGWVTAIGVWALTAARAFPTNGAYRNEAVREVDLQLGRIRVELDQIRCIIRDAVGGLSGSCTELGSASREQTIIARLLNKELSRACSIGTAAQGTHPPSGASREVWPGDRRPIVVAFDSGGVPAPVDWKCEASRIKADLEVVSRLVYVQLGRLESLARETEGRVARVVTSLQFEDIVSQILAHIERRIDTVSMFVEVLGEEGDASPGIGRGRHNCSAVLAERLGAARRLAQETTQRAVKQECLTEGAVDLF